MEFIAAVLVACLISVPYRHLRIRYKLMSYSTDVSDNEFYDSEEMIEAFNQQLQKQKTEEQ